MREEYPKNSDHEMLKRIENYKKAKNNPLKRIGKDRKPSGAVPPKSPAISQERFEELDYEGRGTRVTHQKRIEGIRGATAHVEVQDPRDLPDVVLPSVSIGEKE